VLTRILISINLVELLFGFCNIWRQVLCLAAFFVWRSSSFGLLCGLVSRCAGGIVVDNA
jgi:hypothetical protein